MKLKTLIVSVIVLAALSVGVFVARRPGPPPSQDPRIGSPMADRSVVEKSSKLKITDQGKTVVITRDANGTWRDTSYYDLPADFSKLSGFIGNLTDAKLERLVTSNPERIARLEFKDTKIELLDSADKPVWSVTLGKNSETGGGRFVRFDDEKKAYLASLNAWLDTEAKNWASTELINIKPDDIAKVEIEFPAGVSKSSSTIAVARAKKDTPWTADHTPTGQQLKTDTVSNLLNSVGAIRFSETSDPSDPNVAAAKAHQRTLKITTFDNKTYTVAMGRKPEEKKPKPTAPKVDDAAKKSEVSAKDKVGTDEKKPAEPEVETVPAGPVYVFVTSSDAAAPVNALMQKRAFQISDYVYTGLPQKSDDLFEAAPPPAPASKPGEKKAEEKKAPESKEPGTAK